MMPQQKKVLLVDDDPEDRAIIREMLIERGGSTRLMEAEDGEAAILRLKNCALEDQLPSLIVLDLNMPRLNGTQTLKAIKADERFRQIPVIIYSTSLNQMEKEECKLLGAEDYLVKPLTYADCVKVVMYFEQIAGKTISNTAGTEPVKTDRNWTK